MIKRIYTYHFFMLFPDTLYKHATNAIPSPHLTRMVGALCSPSVEAQANASLNGECKSSNIG